MKNITNYIWLVIWKCCKGWTLFQVVDSTLTGTSLDLELIEVTIDDNLCLFKKKIQISFCFSVSLNFFPFSLICFFRWLHIFLCFSELGSTFFPLLLGFCYSVNFLWINIFLLLSVSQTANINKQLLMWT